MGISATQPTETLSVTESEFQGQVRAAVEGVCTRNILEFYGHGVQTELYADNSASRSILTRLGAEKKTRHFAVKFFWIQRLVKEGLLKSKAISGADNEADIGTKHLAFDRIVKLLAQMNVFLLPLAEASKDGEAGGSKPLAAETYILVGSILMLAVIGLIFLVIEAMKKLKQKLFGSQVGVVHEVQSAPAVSPDEIPIGPVMEMLGIAELYQAPPRGKAHCTKSRRHLKHLKGEAEKTIVTLVWCGDCKDKVKKRIDKVEED